MQGLKRQAFGSGLAAAAVGLGLVHSADATPIAWAANGQGNWYDVTSWNPQQIPGLDDQVTFNDPTVNGVPTTVYHNSGEVAVNGGTVSSLTFNNSAATTLLGGSILTPVNELLRIRAGGITVNPGAGLVEIGSATDGRNLRLEITTAVPFVNNSTSPLNIRNGISGPGGAGRVLRLGGSGNGSIFGTISNGSGGTLGLEKNGPGTWHIDLGSSYTGGTTLNDGRLHIRSSNALGTAAQTLTINGGTLAAINAERTLPANISVVVRGDWGLSGEGHNTQFNGTIDLGDTTRNLTIGVGTAGGGNTVWFGVASGTAGVNKFGPGNLTLSAQHTFSGGITANQGAVQPANHNSTVNASGVLVSGPLGTGTLTLNNGTIYRSNNATPKTVQNNLVLNGGVIFGANSTQTGALTFNSTDGTNTLATPATITLASNTALDVRAATTFANSVSGAFSLQKAGAADLTLSAANTYSGGTTVQAGTLVAANADALGTGALNVADGATARVQAGLPAALSVAGPLGITASGATGGTLNVTDNAMVVRHADQAAAFAGHTTINDLTRNAFHDFAWDQPGVTSSTVAANVAAGTPAAVGILLNNDGGGNALFYGNGTDLPLFEGRSVDGNSVLVKDTLLGDGDLNGTVDTVDFALFQAGYSGAAPYVGFAFGDYDYNGVVDTVDFGLFQAGYQYSQSNPPTAAMVAFATEHGLSLVAAVVPEPATFGLLALAGGGFMLRRRRQAR